MQIIEVLAGSRLEQARELFTEYEAYLNVDLCFQNYAAELANLPGDYAAPGGVLLVAVEGADAGGCVAVRPLSEGICEMKRLFVRPAYRGTGLGRQLARRSVEEAVRLEYRTMRLDTLERLREALALYTSMGFRRIQPYYRNPLEGVVYMELSLENSADDAGSAN